MTTEHAGRVKGRTRDLGLTHAEKLIRVPAKERRSGRERTHVVRSSVACSSNNKVKARRSSKRKISEHLAQRSNAKHCCASVVVYLTAQGRGARSVSARCRPSAATASSNMPTDANGTLRVAVSKRLSSNNANLFSMKSWQGHGRSADCFVSAASSDALSPLTAAASFQQLHTMATFSVVSLVSCATSRSK